jgi:hypothetical protein
MPLFRSAGLIVSSARIGRDSLDRLLGEHGADRQILRGDDHLDLLDRLAAHLRGQERGHEATPDRHHHQDHVLLLHGCKPLGDKMALSQWRAVSPRGVRRPEA